MKYISSIFSTGAVRETPKKVIKKILSEINKNNTASIIEFGAGKGEITKPVVQHIAATPLTYYAFEIDDKFSDLLQTSLRNIHVVSKDAFDFQKTLPSDFKADCIISSMPLSFYSKSTLSEFLMRIKERLNDNGKILILFHAFWMIPFLKKHFNPLIIYRFTTIPPYFLLVFEKESKMQ
jgi:phospholipid N-methyltransferase